MMGQFNPKVLISMAVMLLFVFLMWTASINSMQNHPSLVDCTVNNKTCLHSLSFRDPPIKSVHHTETSLERLSTLGGTPSVLSNTPAPQMASLFSSESSQKRHKNNGTWFVVRTPFDMYIYSAFYDDRLSVGEYPVLRVIVVTENLVKGRNAYCHIFSQGQKTSSKAIKATPLMIGYGVHMHGKYLKEFVLSCRLDQKKVVPDFVAVSGDPDVVPEVRIPVEVPEKLPAKWDFAVCVQIAYWKIEPYHVVEWMELIKILGVSMVTVYNHSLNEQSARVFQHYRDEGFVDLRQSHNFIPDPSQLNLALHWSPVINDCIYRHMHRFQKIVVMDFDEAIVPHKHMNYADMLNAIQKLPDAKYASSFVFRNALFFPELGVDLREPSYSNMLRHRVRLPPRPPGVSVKSIIDPQACTNMHNHMCLGQTELYSKKHHGYGVDPSMGMNHHYKKCHFGAKKCKELISDMENHIKDDTMLKFKDQLLPAVQSQLAKLHLKY